MKKQSSKTSNQNRGQIETPAPAPVVTKPSTFNKIVVNGALALAFCAWAAAAIIGAQFVVAIPFIKILGPTEVAKPLWQTIYSATTYIVALFVIIFVPKLIDNEIHRYSRKNKKVLSRESLQTTREELGLKGLPTFTDIGLAPVFFIAYIFIAAIITNLMTFFPWFNASEAQDVGFNFLDTGMDRIVAFIALVICAPIAEEIIFRGWLYGKIRNRTHAIIAMILVSILFGALHGQWNVAINVGIMSIALCLQREITGTIYSGILLHMLKNGVAFYLLYIAGAR